MADDELLHIHLVRGAGPFADYGMKDGSKIRRECLPSLRKAGIDADRETLVIFCNLGEWDAEKKSISHKSPYYAGGSARAGTAWQLDSPILDTLNLTARSPIIQDGQYGRISLGKHNSIFIGGVAHELGHALGLPHNRQRPEEAAAFGTALMGSGNRTFGDQLRGEGRGSFLTLAHAMRLASHPQFSGSIKRLNTPTRARFDQFRLEVGTKSFAISGRLSSIIPAYAVVAYLDPEGGSDYDATTATAVPDEDGNFSLDCTALAAGKPAELRIVACLANGATHTQKFQYAVTEAGEPDLSSLQLKLDLIPIVKALAAGDAARVVQDQLENPKAREIAERLINPSPRQPSPADLEIDEIPLADTTPSIEEVGWMRPSYNRLPNKDLLLESGGKIFASGIYAHAPAEHRYQLGKKWSSLSGSCGLSAGSSGSVIFVIRADGEERWRSPVTRSGTLHHYEIDLGGVEEVELRVEDAGDGTGSDWGLWLDPSLSKRRRD
ncbi:MAG: NPCBM/NEW2 domain-containing protein [Verrucomicrobiales bacterium]